MGWKLDWGRFRVYLREKYAVSTAFLFIGFVNKNQDLYTTLQAAGFVCVFKPTLTYKNGTTKGNCDAELVLQAMIEYPHYDQAVLVTGDGDFYCLALYLHEKSKLKAILVPNRLKFSALLKWDVFRPYLRYINDLKQKLSYRKKGPCEDGTSKG